VPDPEDREANPLGMLPKLATRGDIAAAGLGLALGYFGDLWLHPFGIQPGAASVYCAAGAVGLKNAVHSWLAARKARKEEQKARVSLKPRVQKLLDLLRSKNENRLASALESDHELWQEGILNDDQFNDILIETIAKFREEISRH
jgi:hypothetical protein